MNFRIVVLALTALAVSACSSDPNRLPPDNPFKPEQTSAREQRLQAGELYRLARESLDSSDFATAEQRYSTLILRFPFTDYAVQGQIDRIYAVYRSYQPEDALAQAERFLRDYPRHPHADYVQYVKGLVNFDRDRGISDSLGFDTTRRDTSNLRRSFDDFSLLVQRYPDSIYVADARERMIFLRNRIAEHELTVVSYYMRRGAYVAAAKRAEQLIAQYPGAPATLEALDLLRESYRELGLKDQAKDAAKLRKAYIAENREQLETAEAEKHGGWFGWLFGNKSGDDAADTAAPPAIDASPASPEADASSGA